MNLRTAPSIQETVAELRSHLRGRVISASDAEYDAARAEFYGGLDLRPAAIVRVADASDIGRVVTLARDRDLELAVRSGGHSIAGHSLTDGGIVIDLHDMRSMEFNLEARTVWAEAGLTARELSAAAWTHGLAIGFGDTGSVGIGGITLGGGIGYLARKFGLTIDSLLEADVVTAGGELIRVSAQEDPDLFWAIRGGGGNFGVATRFRYQLHELPAFYGGMLMLPATPETVAGWISASQAAADELTTIANVMPAPPMPFVPAELHGRVVIMGLIAYAGPAEDAERSVAPFRALATPIVDMVQAMPYPQIYPPDDDTYHPTAVSRTMFVDYIDRDVAETIVRTLGESDAPVRAAQLRVHGGAIARVPSDATAFAHRSSRILVNVAAFYEGPEDQVLRSAWVDAFARTLHQGDDGVYVNFLGDEGPDRIRAAYPGATWDRLVDIKRRYDPTNLFRRNQNIPPDGR